MVYKRKDRVMQTCDKHDSTMDRIFNEINFIKQSQSEMLAKLDIVIAFKDDIHKIIYGNGQEGLISKVRRVLSQLNLQWGLIILIIGALIGYGFKLLVK
jgi:hypothetical protein